MAEQNLSKQWSSEREFFDAKARTAPDFHLRKVAERYERAMGHALYPLEVAYQGLGDLRGKRLLDVGCGLGENSLLFAHWGAQVTGVDVSGESISVARRRALAFGLSDRASFVETPFELANLAEGGYDVIWCAAFLHHVLDRLADICGALRKLVAPRGFVLFSEPIRLSRTIKILRGFVPIRADGTSDERQLERQDIRVVAGTFDIEPLQLFGPVSRLQRLILTGSYEDASLARRSCSDSLYRMDRLLMKLPLMRPAAMVMVAKLQPR